MFTEEMLREAEAAVFLLLQAREDMAYCSVSVKRTILFSAAALIQDLLCIRADPAGRVDCLWIVSAFLLFGGLWLFSVLSGGAVGKGDALTWLPLGLLTGPGESLRILFFASLLFSGYGVYLCTKGRAGLGSRRPFLPFAAAVCLLKIICRGTELLCFH